MKKKEKMIKLQERNKKIEEKARKISLLKIPKKKFVRNGNRKQEEKEPPGAAKLESRSTKVKPL